MAAPALVAVAAAAYRGTRPGRGASDRETRRWNVMRKQTNGEVFRITGARQGLADDVRGRQRRYVISMSVRTVSVVLAATLWNVERHVAIVALVLGVLLPYVAVVIANAGRENVPSLPSSFIREPLRPVIPPVAETTADRTAPDPEAEPEAESHPESGARNSAPDGASVGGSGGDAGGRRAG
ncbi:hypothetical protein GCM10010387_43280 [Streptomyces inusitatus]|uniref:DUF3099 domain-containing protein n=2 Tax=Streptomyces inusitatus TaxID=68221 RepID=A0A918UYE9_9ACTN|nr:hypothetical protein GCM10010387_43280 [Streptomyces inusitatus]